MSIAWKHSRHETDWKLRGAEKTFRPRSPSFSEEERAALERELRQLVDGEIRFDDGSRALYATDGSNYRQTPIGVVIPRDLEDVEATVAVCNRFGAPIVSRGGGTSLAGQCCNVAVVIDFSKNLHRIIEIDPARQTARIQPGVILDVLRNEAEKFHLTFGPDPSTHTHCTLGGMIGNNACGRHAQMAGRTAENVHELEILTYDGLRMKVGPTSEAELRRIIESGRQPGEPGDRRSEIYRNLRELRDRYAPLIRARYPKIPRRVSGFNLDELLPENGFHLARALVGTEGTCVTLLEATVRLVPSPPYRSVVVLGYPDIYEAGDHIPDILPFKPLALEGMDDKLIHYSKLKNLHPEALTYLPEGKGWLIVELGGASRAEADARARELMARLKFKRGAPTMKLFENKEEELKIWEVRESGLGATARVPGMRDTWEGWEDAAVPPERLGAYLRDFRQLLNRHQYGCALYGHFGQGCVHTRIDFDLQSADGIARYRDFIEEAAELVVSYGGSLSGEHGDGQSRGELLGKMFGPELVQAFAEFKAIWDPQFKMNPGKVVDPYRLDENLRLGSDYRPAQPATHFHYPEDRGSLAYAALRCVGVGKCRRLEKGTMCPSFRATLEEKHSTRGRAHLLHEMLTAETIKDGWESAAVKEALDLCLSCKGCKSECPMNVDVATYKAEFLSHYYKNKPRPPAAYSMGRVDFWAKLAARAPQLANFAGQTPVLRDIAKKLGGIAPERKLPRFATQTFRSWFFERARRQQANLPRVVLWADTFNNHFHPEVAIAATHVLEAAGFGVVIPQKQLCCGRPLYDYGFLDHAKRYLKRSIQGLRPYIQKGIPVVALEPSCASVFKDELKNLLPHDSDGARLREQFFLFSEFLMEQAHDFHPPALHAKALLHLHCHHKTVLNSRPEKQLLERAGLEVEVLDSGCCGMAGSFGFEREPGRFALSKKIGEAVLLPAVRRASSETLIVTSGFSCGTQIEQLTRRKHLHTAQVLELALKNGPGFAGK
jgi:FAD/FMN-containing dehydrogenase/Fe-S oxidoreductase